MKRLIYRLEIVTNYYNLKLFWFNINVKTNKKLIDKSFGLYRETMQ